MDINLENILKQDNKIKLAILAGTLVLILVIYVWALYLPSKKAIEGREKRLARLLDQKAEQEAIVQNLDAFKAECQNLEIELASAGAYYDRPQGRLAEHIYGTVPAYLNQIKRIKDTMDERRIFNPGRPVKEV